MATSYCPTLGTDPAVLFASGGYATFMNLAPRTFEEALRLTQTLGDFAVTPISFNATFNFEDQLTPFQRPLRPDVDMTGFRFNTPPAPGADGFLDLEAPLPAGTAGKQDLCVRFTGDTRPQMWVLDRITLQPR